MEDDFSSDDDYAAEPFGGDAVFEVSKEEYAEEAENTVPEDGAEEDEINERNGSADAGAEDCSQAQE